jgi:TP901 family phage tail tape measure protein
MAFDAGAVVGKAFLDSSGWVSGANQIDQSNTGLQKSAGAVGKAAAAAGAALIAGLTASVVAANDFQKSFSNVRTLVDESVVDVNAMRNELLGLDSRLGSAKELTEGLYQALSASVEPGQAVQFVGEAAQFAKAALIDTNTAVDVITTGLNAYGLEADRAGDISDKLFSVIKLGKTTGDELAATIGQSIPLAANMGVEFDELGASVAILTRQGVKASEATTQFNGIINSLLKPTEDMKAAFDELGFASGEAAIESLGFKGTLDALIGTTDGSKEELAGLFANTRALRGALGLTGEGAKDFNDVLNEIETSAGATSEAFGKQEITFETLSNSINKVAIIVGQQLLPFVFAATDAITEFVQETIISDEFISGLQETIGFLGGAFAVLQQAVTDIIEVAIDVFNEELLKTEETLDGAGTAADDSISVWEILAKVFAVISGVVNTLIKGFGGLIRATINSAKVIGSVADLLGEVGKLLTFQEADLEGAWNRIGDNLENFVVTAVDDFVNVGASAVDTITGLFDANREKAKELEDTFTKTRGDIKQTFDELNFQIDKTNKRTIDITIDTNLPEVVVEFEEASKAVNDFETRMRALYKQTTLNTLNMNAFINSMLEGFNEALLQTLQQNLLSPFEAVGEALITGGDALLAFGSSFLDLVGVLVSKVAELLLIAGLELIIAGQIPLGVALIGASALVALGAGLLSGFTQSLTAEETETSNAEGVTSSSSQMNRLNSIATPTRIVAADETGGIGRDININSLITVQGNIEKDVDLDRFMKMAGKKLQSELRAITS